MKRQRIEKAVEVLNYAIKNQVSAKEACVKCGFSDTYVKNTKADVHKTYKKGRLSLELYDLFFNTYNKYAQFAVNTNGGQNPSGQKVSEPNKPRDIPKGG